MPNRLINETSPYLLQHAHNPVDWYPWGDEALQKARDEDKPILVSIGYSSCHWCHVMERESYEDERIASVMNDLYVNIKVDREERPDVDGIFMTAVQALSGHGGWPLNVFLTPDGKPFYGGTYYPPEERQGMPAWLNVLESVHDAYRERRVEVVASADQLMARMREMSPREQSEEPLTEDILQQAFQSLSGMYDEEHGGFGDAPKFPQPTVLEFLLRHHVRNKDDASLQMLESTLQVMARAGIYDQVAGGFHRYATDAEWQVPHFEKMLYDNALLSRVYLHAYQVTKNPFYRRIVEETLDYVLREMRDSKGGFYSAQDADSEGVEGKFYVWTPAEIAEALGEEDANLVEHVYGVTEAGNFEGSNILHLPDDLDAVAETLGLTSAALEERMSSVKAALLTKRNERVAPQTDDKVLVVWNGMMARSLAEAGAVLERQDYREAAVDCVSFLLDNVRDEDGRLLRTYRAGKAHLKGYLDDHALLTDALLAVYEMTFDARWLFEAKSLATAMVDLFWDESEGIFYDTGRDHEELIVRPRELLDSAVPSGLSSATDVLLKLSDLVDEADFRRKATATLRTVQDFLGRAPQGMGQWLCDLDFYVSPPKEVVLIGPRHREDTEAMLREIYATYRPTTIVVGAGPDGLAEVESLPLFEAREMIGNAPTVFVCENYACMLPATTPEALAGQLAGPSIGEPPPGLLSPFP